MKQITEIVCAMGFWLWVLLWITTVAGCGSASPFAPDVDYATERAMAEIAIASVTAERSPTPSDPPKVGDKCPQCNDPPGTCGVGKVGDGTNCEPCRDCGGDGRIDDRDLQVGPPPAVGAGVAVGDSGEHDIEPVPDPVPNAEPVQIQKEITLHMTEATRRAWPSAWFANDREAFESAGWIVRAVLEPESVTKVAYFDVIAPDGEVFQFYQPITLDPRETDKVDVSHLETR